MLGIAVLSVHRMVAISGISEYGYWYTGPEAADCLRSDVGCAECLPGRGCARVDAAGDEHCPGQAAEIDGGPALRANVPGDGAHALRDRAFGADTRGAGLDSASDFARREVRSGDLDANVHAHHDGHRRAGISTAADATPASHRPQGQHQDRACPIARNA